MDKATNTGTKEEMRKKVSKKPENWAPIFTPLAFFSLYKVYANEL